MVIYLRYTIGFTESQCTLFFHIFEVIVYMTVFLSGQWALYSYKPILFFTPWANFFGFLLFMVSLFSPKHAMGMALLSFFMFAFAHGLNMATNLNLEYELRNRYVRRMMIVNILIECVMVIIIPTYFDHLPLWFGQMFVSCVMVSFTTIVLFFQIWVLLIFFRDQRRFSNYGPWDHMTCIIYRLFLPLTELMTKEGRARKKERLKKLKQYKSVKQKRARKQPLTDEERQLRYHWIDAVVPPYAQDLIDDMKYKLHYWTIILTLPCIFLAFELRYTYWLFAAQRMNRFFFTAFPVQTIITFQQLVFLIVIPAYCFIMAPGLGVFRGLKKMAIGCILIMLAMLIGLKVVYDQEKYQIRPAEPFFDQSMLAVRNGLDCDIWIDSR